MSPRSQTFDSNGPDVRVRGNAHQVHEKYLSLARDASASGDRIAAESYYQFAEHYFRLLNDSTDPPRPGDPQRPPRDRGPHQRDGRPQGPPNEQPVVDMGFEQPADGGGFQERPQQRQGDRHQGRRANGHRPPDDAMAGDGPTPIPVSVPVEGDGPRADARKQPEAAPVAETRSGESGPADSADEAPRPAPRAAKAAPVSAEAPVDAEAVPEKPAPAKRRVGRPRRKPANGAAGAAKEASKAAQTADEGTEKKSEEPASDPADKDAAST